MRWRVCGARDDGACEARVEAGSGEGERGSMRAVGASGDLVWVPDDVSTCGGADAEARVEGSEGFGEAVGVGSVVGEVGTRRRLTWRRRRWLVVVVGIDGHEGLMDRGERRLSFIDRRRIGGKKEGPAIRRRSRSRNQDGNGGFSFLFIVSDQNAIGNGEDV